MGGTGRTLAWALASSPSVHAALAGDRPRGTGDRGADRVLDLLDLRPLGEVEEGADRWGQPARPRLPIPPRSRGPR